MTKKERSVFVALWEEAVDFLVEAGGCDHSVGICCCSLERAVEDGFEILEKHLTTLALRHRSTPTSHPLYATIQQEHADLQAILTEARHALAPKRKESHRG